jgi:L-aminopeptidase/D-esterase-like protein
MKLLNSITDIPGIRVGHAQNEEAVTGCTIVLCEGGAVGGVDQRGGAPGTRETDGLHPMHLVERVHGVMLSGGSAFGLDAASGAVRYLEERGIGFDVRVARVPIVPAAILFDLGVGRPDVRPDAAMGYQACLNASDGSPSEGNFGAGTGATVGKILGLERAMKAGVGSACIEIGSGIVIGAIAAVNAFGDIIDPRLGRIIAGARAYEQDGRWIGCPPDWAIAAGLPLSAPVGKERSPFADSLWVMDALAGRDELRFGRSKSGNTVIGVVATNAGLNKEQVNKMAQMAQDGVARTVRPAHTMLDGDTVFALSTGSLQADINVVGAYAAEVLSLAILRAVRLAASLPGLPSVSELEKDFLSE